MSSIFFLPSAQADEQIAPDPDDKTSPSSKLLPGWIIRHDKKIKDNQGKVIGQYDSRLISFEGSNLSAIVKTTDDDEAY